MRLPVQRWCSAGSISKVTVIHSASHSSQPARPHISESGCKLGLGAGAAALFAEGLGGGCPCACAAQAASLLAPKPITKLTMSSTTA